MTIAELSIGLTTEKLPVGWRWARLGEVADYINGMAFKPEDWGNSGVPIIRIQNLNSSNASFNYFRGDFDARYRVNPGDLLISWSASLDAYIWEGEPGVLNQHIFKVIEHHRYIIRQYLYFAARGAMVEIRSRVHGATMSHITRPEFESIKIPLPPLAEQRRIAAALTEQLAAVERARAAAAAQVEAAKALPAAYLRAVFESDEARAWPRVALGAVCEFLAAKSIATDGEADVLAVTTACLSEVGFNPAGAKSARMREADVQSATLTQSEVLIARSNTPELVGRASLYSGELPGAVASDLTIRMRTNSKLEPPFLSLYLSALFATGYWRERAGGASSTMKKITRSQLVVEAVPLPSREAQAKVSESTRRALTGSLKLLLQLQLQAQIIEELPVVLLREGFSGTV